MLERKEILDSVVYIHTGATDMRCGFDRLSQKVAEELSRSVLAGGLYVFLSRCRRRVKVLYWDKDGYALWHKRLEAGVFRVERRRCAKAADEYEEVTGVDLDSLLSGMDFSRIKMRKSAENGLFA
jgi:transposase